jgi:hypothetical protein
MRSRFLLITAIIALGMSAATASAAEVVWSGLVIAQNASEPQPVPAELARFEKTL